MKSQRPPRPSTGSRPSKNTKAETAAQARKNRKFESSTPLSEEARAYLERTRERRRRKS